MSAVECMCVREREREKDGDTDEEEEEEEKKKVFQHNRKQICAYEMFPQSSIKYVRKN